MSDPLLNENSLNGHIVNGNGHKLPPVKKVAIIYSFVKREFFPTEVQYITEKSAYDDAVFIGKELEKLGIETTLIPTNESIIEQLTLCKPEVVFNLTDSIKGNEYLSATIPGILDMMDIPFTGSGLLGLALCYNKFLIKKLLQTAGIPVPNFQLFHTPSDKLNIDMRFPLISKLNEIHGAVEINQDAVSENERHLRDRLAFLIKTYNQPVIVEEFIAGREITAYVLQGNFTKIYFAEKVFNKPDQKYIFATFDDQWGECSSDKSTWPYTYAKYEDNLLKDYVKRAFDITDMQDYAKFDVRLDASGRYYFIDSNANPAFGPKELNTSMGLIIQELYGVPFGEILRRLINNTLGVNSESGISNAGEVPVDEQAPIN
ncbi:hypothetical protein COT50_04190 [candidate division WWE3 bacterium CG08_land_8_20_14_0_20_41_10]|uniref:ATP-grasp domain-containing protein n=1 Tax=candidate division WWE3 bacterium CG08_land_8_20_14_0_20_41_10 TaxID=1975085 RepID=A0A2H0XAT8_UNCKA|nr:MAG: hypothetical protein COT50_04190 [candidate division WWE3 bacterium CG08_land_8_20_14_0_20_41_10]